MNGGYSNENKNHNAPCRIQLILSHAMRATPHPLSLSLSPSHPPLFFFLNRF
jgi:hypothetical protein